MIIGSNPNYPALHVSEALQSIVEGDHHFDADDVRSVIGQANTLIAERGNSITQHELSNLKSLLDSVKGAA